MLSLSTRNKHLKQMGSCYLTRGFFVLVLLGAIALLEGFKIFRSIAYINDELLIVPGVAMLTSTDASGAGGLGKGIGPRRHERGAEVLILVNVQQ